VITSESEGSICEKTKGGVRTL